MSCGQQNRGREPDQEDREDDGGQHALRCRPAPPVSAKVVYHGALRFSAWPGLMPGKLRERFYPKGCEPAGRRSVKKARNRQVESWPPQQGDRKDPLARPTTNGRMPGMNVTESEPLWRSLA